MTTLVAIVGASVLGVRDAWAYTIETPITQGCHESITMEAMRRVRGTGVGAPLPSTQTDDDPLIEDLNFTVDDDFKDIGGAALLIGVRDNDLGSLPATALEEISVATADPAVQRQHCLRGDNEKEPEGSSMAVDDCRGFIKEELLAALDGLGPDGAPDVNNREQLSTHLALRGRYTVSIPRFYLFAGRAVHALQDSFTHTFRSAGDPHKISVVLDWIDYAENTLDESRDGPPHMKQLDRCDDPDDLRKQRHALAIEATALALSIVLDATLTRDAKAAAIDKMLDTYVTYDAAAKACTAANSWCDAAENQYRSSTCGCAVVGSSRLGTGASLALASVVVLALFRRRPRRRGPRRAGGAAMLIVIALIAAPRIASADTPPPSDAPEHAPGGNPIALLTGGKPAARPGTNDPAGSVFGHGAIGASYDHPAMSVSLGAKYQWSRPWMVGLDVEWNPWIPTVPLSVRAGTGNVYASIVRRYQMPRESVNFRTTGALGASMLLMRLPGAAKYSYGPLIGISFIGLELKLSPGFFLVIDPTYIIFTIPHVTGSPLPYSQYRFQVALEFGG